MTIPRFTAPVEWHREDADRCRLIYSLMQKGWRKGQPVMVNDVAIRVEACNGSDTDIGPIADAIQVALSAAPAPVGGAVSEGELRDAIALILPLAKGYAAANRVGSNQSYVDYVENLIAPREEAPAEAGGDDDDASTYRPSIAGLSDYLWNQALAADSVESRCILEMWREAVDAQKKAIGEKDEAFCEAYYDAHLNEAWSALREGRAYQLNADGAICLIQQAAADRRALRAQPPARSWGWDYEICTGCSASLTAADIKAGGHVSCCPDRRMVTVRDLVDAYEAQRKPAREDAQPVAYNVHRVKKGDEVWIRAKVTDPCTSCCGVAVKTITGEVHRYVSPVDVHTHPGPDALRGAIVSVLSIKDAADSFRDCSGDEVAGQVIIRCDQALAALQAEQKGGA